MNETPSNDDEARASEAAWLIKVAKRAIEKRLDFEDLKYSDDLYGKEDKADDVWELVEECETIGRVAFNEKYPS